MGRAQDGESTYHPVLQRFDLKFLGSGVDKEINRIRVQIDAGAKQLRICFNDQDPIANNDRFKYRVQYYLVPKSAVLDSGSVNLNEANDSDALTSNFGGKMADYPYADTVLSGFDLDKSVVGRGWW